MVLATLGFLAIYTGAARSDKTEKYGGKEKPAIPVIVARVTQKTVPVQLQAIGNVQSSSTVAITPQASGRIVGVYFQKGQTVKKGQLLFTLDDRSQRAAIQQAQGMLAKDQAQIEQAKATLAKDEGLVRQAQATLAKDEAQAQYAQAQSQRYRQLLKQGVVSQDQAQQYATNNQVSLATLQADREAIANAQAVVQGDLVAIQNAQAVVKGDLAAIQNAEAVKNADQAALEAAKVQLSYTQIYAPIDGRAGNILVTQGNVVQANSSNPLVIITKIRPIQVSFAVPEADLPQVQHYMDHGKLKVNIAFSNGDSLPVPGVLTFINNTVDNSTGTIQLIGDFDNTNGHLFPGQFVNTTLTLTQERNATVVPAQAVQNGPDGQFVFVVKPDMTVENVSVKASSSIDGLAVIQAGVQPGEQVVTDGQANLVSGSKIRLKLPSDRGKHSTENPNAQPRRHRHAPPAGGNS
jgi:multidrug efflux system membrane fusion protein